MRIGHGFDAHRFGAVREDHHIMLGGVPVPHTHEVIAHSDGDVILHALTDALLGAMALGDIGAHFPDTDPAFEAVDSRTFLKAAYRKATDAGLKLENADVTLIAEKPKVRSYVDAMRAVIAGDLDVSIEQVSIKATTTEKMGYIGREEGLAAQAAVLLS